MGGDGWGGACIGGTGVVEWLMGDLEDGNGSERGKRVFCDRDCGRTNIPRLEEDGLMLDGEWTVDGGIGKCVAEGGRLNKSSVTSASLLMF